MQHVESHWIIWICCTGIVIDSLKQYGTICNKNYLLKISVKTGLNWSAHCLKS